LARRVELYERIGRETFIAFLMNRLTGQDQRDGWDRIAVLSIYVDMLETQRDLTRAVIAEPDPDSALAELLEQKKTLLAQVQLTADQIGSDGTTGLAALAVLSSQIGRLR
jgi:NAD-specific glutamate dehydrogenase